VREPSAITDMRLVILFQLISSFVGLLVDYLRVIAVSHRSVIFRVEQFLMMPHQVLFGLKIKCHLGANETVMGKARFEQWLRNMAYVEVKHYHGDNGIFSAEEYCQECINKGQTQSFLA
jgi:hypothetical protein